MDKLDFEIIRRLIDNSRTPFSKISSELGVSTDTIIRRYNRLKETGAIKPTINVNIFKIGYDVRVWYLITLMRQTDTSAMVEKITKEHKCVDNPSLEEVISSEVWAREEVHRFC